MYISIMSAGSRPSAGIVITANLRQVILQVVSSYLNIIITSNFSIQYVTTEMTSLKNKGWFFFFFFFFKYEFLFQYCIRGLKIYNNVMK